MPAIIAAKINVDAEYFANLARYMAIQQAPARGATFVHPEVFIPEPLSPS
jgi:hypothetical protein